MLFNDFNFSLLVEQSIWRFSYRPPNFNFIFRFRFFACFRWFCSISWNLLWGLICVTCTFSRFVLDTENRFLENIFSAIVERNHVHKHKSRWSNEISWKITKRSLCGVELFHGFRLQHKNCIYWLWHRKQKHFVFEGGKFKKSFMFKKALTKNAEICQKSAHCYS